MDKLSFKLINLKPIVDGRGKLVSAEAGKEVPFAIKRFFCLYDIAPGATRGEHAHKKTRLILYCLTGACTVILDNGREVQSVRLSHPHKGLLIEPLVWHHIEKCTRGAVVLALASNFYNESDYIRDYGEYKKYI